MSRASSPSEANPAEPGGSGSDPAEIEFELVVGGQHPERTLEAIAALETLAGAARALGEALLALMPGVLEPATIGKYARGLQLARSLPAEPASS